MPRQTARYLQEYADTWSTRGVRAWYEGWWEVGKTTGDLLAPIVGVARGTISMHQNVTVAMGIIGSCHSFEGTRRKIVMTDLEFPSNMSLFRLWGSGARSSMCRPTTRSDEPRSSARRHQCAERAYGPALGRALPQRLRPECGGGD